MTNSALAAVALSAGNNNANTTCSGVLSGPGSLTKIGTGALTLTNTSSYSGPTAVNAGTLVLNGSLSSPVTINLGGTLQVGNAKALSGGTLAINAGPLDLHGFSITLPSLNGPAGTISDLSSTGTGTTTLSVNQSGNSTFGGTIQNGPLRLLALNKSGSGILTLSGSNSFSGGTTIGGGTLNVANALALENSTVLVANSNSLRFSSSLSTVTLGGLTGSGNIALANAASAPVMLNVGQNGQNSTYSGSLGGSGGLTKQGSGTLTLAVSSAYSGATVIAGGVLQIGDTVLLNAAA